jgi:hypothetical protein
MHPARTAWRVVTAGLLLLLASCGGGGGGGGGGGPAPLVITTTTLADGVIGTAYTQTVITTGGTGAKNFSITTGTLPPGLVLNATSGAISGSPTGAAGVSDLTVSVTDSGSPQQTDTQALSVEIATPLVVTSGAPPLAMIGVPYNYTVTATGGTPPYEYFLDLPPGLSVNASGQISGTPAANGHTASLSGTVSDGASPPQSADANARIRVALEAMTTVMPDATAGTEYEQLLEARGGLPPYNWAIVSGSLPSGIQHSGGGLLVGDPVGSCSPTTSTFGAQVTDSDTPAQSDTQTGITLSVNKGPLSLQAQGLPVARVGFVYNTTNIRASLGVPPYSFAITSGALPAGLSMSPTTAHLTGMPTADGTYTFTVRVTDSCATTAFRPYTLTVGTVPLGRNDSIATATAIGNGSFFASLSPSGHPNTVYDPDEDFYSITTTAASTVTVDIDTNLADIDTVIEIVNVNGTRLMTCTPPGFTSSCANDDENGLDSLLQVQLIAATTFYVRVLDWRGDARPDFQYFIKISGAN